MKIGFWNVAKEDLSDLIVSLVLENQLDIICLAEITEATVLSFLQKINLQGSPNKYIQVSCCKDKLTLITSYPALMFEDKSDLYSSVRYVAHNIKTPKVKLNLISVHLHAKSRWSADDLSGACTALSINIQKIEEETNCTNTILIGDFNMNPFENGMVSANGLNTVSDLNDAFKKRGRIVDNVFYKYFYNPMWNFFGDFKEPLGTYYYRSPGHISHEWHIYDQVIFRPIMKPYLDKKYIQIVTKIGLYSLTKQSNRPDAKNYSDHLPIIFTLKL